MDAINALVLIEALFIIVAVVAYKARLFISHPPHVFDPAAVDSSNSDVVPTSMASSSSSPSFDITVASPPTKHDVFLSFRGEDTRDNFTSHLYKELCRAKIQAFIDNRLEKGKEISPILQRTIEESNISVIIFSKEYASSTWCLDELVKILECKKKYGMIVIPVFYNVDPTTIRKPSGSYGDAFIKHEQRFKDNKDKVERWKDALTQVANISGWDSTKIRPESKLTRQITKDVLRKLDMLSSYSSEGLVGIQHHILHMEELLSLDSRKVCIVGIWGMGGIGKTTLAQVLFQKLKAQFESCSFVANSREQLTRIGLDQLHNKCLSELLDDGEIGTYNVRSSYVKSRLQRKKILLVLDDVENYIQAKDLIKLCDWFGEGSKIIITSRDKQVLKNAAAYRTYHVQEMDFNKALQLFSLKAFKKKEPPKNYAELSEFVVNHCQGIPLALIVFGCFLYGRRKEEWESTLKKLKQAPDKEIFNVLKISFDGLDDNQKTIFLDLACFFKERYNPFMEHMQDHMRDYYDFPIDIEICVLIDKSLISVKNGVIMMHDLVRAMGREIAHQQFISEPRKSIRLWKHEDIYHVFKNSKDTEMIRGIHLDICNIKHIHLKANAFQQMYNMRFLVCYKSCQKELSKIFISEGINILPEELRFLCWEDYPLSYIPLRFCAENLVDLIMPNSHIQQLWDGDQHFPSLKRIDLQGSKHLIELPNLSQAPNLENIDLYGCENLVQVCSSTILTKLHILVLANCSNRWCVNLGAGNNDGITLGLVAIYNYFDLDNFSLFKVSIKVLTSDTDKFSGFEFKAEWAPFTEILGSIDTIESAELKSLGQCLASLLPFVSKLRWLDIPIELGNFGNHFEMHFSHDISVDLSRKMKKTDLRLKLTQPKMIESEQNLMQPCMKGSTMKEVALSLEQWVDLQSLTGIENCSSNRLTMVPKSINRWSLLTDLLLQKSDIVSVTWSILGLSTLKSIVECDSTRLQPITDLKFSMNKGMDASEFFIYGYHSPNASRYDSRFFCLFERFIYFTLMEELSRED